MRNIKKRIQELQFQKHLIEKEILNLQKTLKEHKKELTKDEKIEIFKSLFVGRFDIYLKKWINKDNTRQCYYKATQTFKQNDYLPLTNSVIEEHLRGNIELATYPINRDNLTKYITINLVFEDIAKIEKIFSEYKIPAYLQNDSNGDFLFWIFFTQKFDAKNVKVFGEFLLKKADISAKLIPNEEFVNASSLGRYVELPLYLRNREKQKSIFLEPKTFIPIEDQWEYLQNIARFDLGVLKGLLSSNISPKNINFKQIVYPDFVNFYISDGIYIDTKELSESFLKLLKSFATFENPQIKVLLSLRKPLYNTPKIISSFEENFDKLKLPRGLLNRFLNILKQHNIEYDFEDKRVYEYIEFPQILYTLRDEQQDAISKLVEKDFSICVAPPGFGKTLIGAKMINLRRARTLVVVHKNMLLEQWIERFINYFKFEKKQIGYLGKGKNTLNGVLDVATMQSLKNSPQIIKNYSFVIVDECHHIPAVTFEQIIKLFNGKYILGLSATPNRKDEFEPILFQQLGDIAYEYKTKKTRQNELIVIKTNFKSTAQNYAIIINELILDKQRNEQIIEQIVENKNKAILVLSDRIEHITEIEKLLMEKKIEYLIVHGSLNKKEQSENMLKVKDSRLVLATTSFFGEGIDFPHLNCIIFATPISYFGRVVQYLGRVGRDGQICLAIDFLDHKNGMLNSTYKKRYEGYRQMSYKIKKVVQ